MVMKRLPALPLVLVGLVIIAACSSSSNASPNKSPGQCVLSNGVWYCGTGYGDYPDCAAAPAASQCVDSDGGMGCFSCSEGAGATCSCQPGDAGRRFWYCVPTGTGCSE